MDNRPVDAVPQTVRIVVNVMPDHEFSLLAYAQLAQLSKQKRQMSPRDKFLILAAASACRAGWPDVAETCRTAVLTNNPAHLIGHYATFVDAMQSTDFEPFQRRLERFCSREKAEHLLSELGIDIPQPVGSQTVGELALSLITAE